MIAGKKLVLRAITTKDIEVLRKWINDAAVCRGLMRHLPVTDFEHRAWFRDLKKDKNQVYFAIELKKNKKYIGNVGLRNINWKDRNGSFFIYIGDKKCWGKGCGTEATELFVDYCFNKLNLHKVCLSVAAFNKGAVRIYEKAGFIREGVLRKEYYCDGKYHDVIRMGIIKRGK